ncbi:MAG: fluoride efflux transporter CrcB [Nitrospirae bacterium]|nr:fluoride efflux transporter CrcB [Nitrospirota bacterium]MBI5695699.1 fluoride efflux transporter CrcB [Nitrospirota bacterium]
MFQKLILLACVGAAGTLCRYWVSGLAHRALGPDFAYGTLAVNVVGSLLFGVVWTLAEERFAISNETRFIILTGFMGAFTTFSTFAFETVNFLRDSQYALAMLNVSANCILGFGAVISGMWLARAL